MPEAGAELDALAREFYEVWLRYHPDLALVAGFRPAGVWLPAQDDVDLAALRSWLETFILGLDEIDFDALDLDRQADFELMLGAARVEHAELLDHDWRCRDPGCFLPLVEIHRLMLDPPESLRDPLVELLSAIPERLRQAQVALRAQSQTMSAILVRAAAREADSGRRFLRDIVCADWLRRRCYGLVELDALAEGARAALAGYRDFLVRDLVPAATGGLGCGSEQLHRRLGHLHFLECDPLALGEPIARALRATEDRLACLPAPALAEDRCPESGASAGWLARRLTLYRSASDALAAELRASDLVTLPGAPLRLAVAPACPGPHRYAIDYLSDRDAANGGGTLYLPAAGPDGDEETLSQIRDRCLAQGWGGSHLHAWAAPERASRVPRRVANGVSLRVAWETYLLGRLAGRAGEGGETGGLRRALVRRRDRLLLARLDLEVHTGRIDADRALVRLEGSGLDAAAADSLLARIARAPGDALAGAIGWCLLEAAHICRAEAGGAAPDERELNDRLLAQGPIPLPLGLRCGLGEALAEAAWERAMGGAGRRGA